MSRRHQSRRRFLGTTATAVATGLAGCTGLGATGRGSETDAAWDGGDGTDPGQNGSVGTTTVPDDGDLTVFHAGSLEPPFAAVESDFEAAHGLDVAREPRGSVGSTKKITEQGRHADVLGVADFRLLRARVLPEFADWYAVFATNAMAIQYSDDAPGADEIRSDNWWEVLSRDDVAVGHSDPAVDPGGYRAIMVQQLGTEAFDGDRLYDEATYQKLRANSTVPSDTEINLVSQIESGKLDYVIYYQSIAETTGLPWVELQPAVDLSKLTARHARHYANATVETASGTFTGAPIAYGITVPSVAESPGLGARWVDHVATEPGREALRVAGFSPVEPVVVPTRTEEAVPDRVARHARSAASLGPLTL